MNEFSLGVVVGLAGGLLAVVSVLRSRRAALSRLRDTVLSIMGVPAAEVSLAKDIVQDVRENDPGLASVIEAAPAVPVASVPEEVPLTDQDAIRLAATDEAALNVAKRFIRDPGVAKAFTTLVRWKTRAGNDEDTFQRSFRNHANRSGYSGALAEKQRIPWGGGGGSRVAIPDFLLDDRVLVEIKAGLEASGETDRAMGQMLRYLLAWKGKGPAILAVCGRITPELRFLVRLYVRTWRRQLNLPVTVYFKFDDDASRSDEHLEMPTEAPRLESGERV